MSRTLLIGAAFSGGGACPGSELAPDALDQAMGSKRFAEILSPASGESNQSYLTRLYQLIESHYRAGDKPLIIGGDHSISIASISAASNYLTAQNKRLGVIWVDAHADINTPESSPSGNLHGMPLAVLLGMGEPAFTEIGGPQPKIKKEALGYLGLRAVDKEEAILLDREDICAITSSQIFQEGVVSNFHRVINRISEHCDRFIVSFDLDVFSPEIAPGVSTPEADGLNKAQGFEILELARNHPKYFTTEFVEFNPIKDIEDKTKNLLIELLAWIFQQTSS